MSFNPPLKIHINSDGTELEFVTVKSKVYTYKWVKSEFKFGTFLNLTEHHLQKLLMWNEVNKNIEPSTEADLIKH